MMYRYLAMIYRIGEDTATTKVFECAVEPDAMPHTLDLQGVPDKVAKQLGLEFNTSTHDLVIFDVSGDIITVNL